MNPNWTQPQHPPYMAYHQGQSHVASDVTYYNQQGQPMTQAPPPSYVPHHPAPAPMSYNNHQVCYNAYGCPPQTPPPPPPPPPKANQYGGNSMYSSNPMNTAVPQNAYNPQHTYSYNNMYYSQLPTQSQPLPPHPQAIQQKPLHPPPQQETPTHKRRKQSSKSMHLENSPHEQPFHCKACKITFPNQAALSAHTSSHIKCHHPNCEFEGSKRVVAAHYSQQHGKYSGRGLKSIALEIPGTKKVQRFKICVGSHPQDIQAWIEERKRKFPTRQRILEKEEKKKRKRGDILDLKPVAQESEKRTVGDEQGNEEEDKVDPTMEAPQSSLQSLMAGYGSSDDEASEQDLNTQSHKDEKVTGETMQQTVSTPSNVEASESQTNFKFKKGHCHHFIRRGTCKHGDACFKTHDLKEREAFKAFRTKQMVKKRARRKEEREEKFIRNGTSKRTLLRGLLQNDIQRERSLTLQLLRYIVDSNYLQS